MEYRLILDGQLLAFQDEEDHSETETGDTGESGDEPVETVGVDEHAEDTAVVNPILPVGKEILWAIVFFAILFAAMRFVLVPPIKAAMDERKEKIRSAKEAADRVDSAMGSAQADYDAAVSGAREEANQIIDTARAEADTHKAAVQAEANTEIAALRASADAEISAARGVALAELRGDVSQLATSAASTVIGKSIDVGSAQSVIDSILDGGN